MKSLLKVILFTNICIFSSFVFSGTAKDYNALVMTTDNAFDKLFSVLLIKKDNFETGDQYIERQKVLFKSNLREVNKNMEIKYSFDSSSYDADSQRWLVKIANLNGNMVIGDNFNEIRTFDDNFVEVPLSDDLYQEGKGFYQGKSSRSNPRDSLIGPIVDVKEYYRIYYFPDSSKEAIIKNNNGFYLSIPMSIFQAKVIGVKGTVTLYMKITAPFIAARVQQVNVEQLINGISFMTGKRAPKNTPIENIRTNYLITEITGFAMQNSMNLKVREASFPSNND